MLTGAGLATMILLGAPPPVPTAQAAQAAQAAQTRIDAIRSRGHLTCGVEPAVPGFVALDAVGRYVGLDVDICRAVATAILGAPDQVRFVDVTHVSALTEHADIDLVARRLTWELRRERPLGLLFGPVTFYDGQGFLVRRTLRITRPGDLADLPICVAAGPVFELNLNQYFEARSLPLTKVVLESPHAYDEIAEALDGGRCDAYSGDLSDLGAIRLQAAAPDDFQILDELISKEPLAPLVRDDDIAFFHVMRWTVAAMIRAEELGVSSRNVAEMRASADLEVQRLLGVVAGNGTALGLRETWAVDVIALVGNYGEVFERNVGRGSPLGLSRGLNRLWTDGGLMYAPPLR